MHSESAPFCFISLSQVGSVHHCLFLGYLQQPPTQAPCLNHVPFRCSLGPEWWFPSTDMTVSISCLKASSWLSKSKLRKDHRACNNSLVPASPVSAPVQHRRQIALCILWHWVPHSHQPPRPQICQPASSLLSPAVSRAWNSLPDFQLSSTRTSKVCSELTISKSLPPPQRPSQSLENSGCA